MSFDWAQQVVSQITTSRYTFVPFLTALQESLQLQEEMSRAKGQATHYGQHFRHPRDVRHPNNRRGDRSHWSPRRNSTRTRHESRSRSPVYRDYRDGYSNTLSSGFRNASDNQRNRNPNLQRGRFCLGYGSPDHILRNTKCTPTLESIKTNVLESIDCLPEDDEILTDQFLTLHTLGNHDPASKESRSPGRESVTAPRRHHEQETQVQFEESLYVACEANKLEAQIDAEFRNEMFFVRGDSTGQNLQKDETFDCSHINFSLSSSYTDNPGFCVDIGAPRSVIERKRLECILRQMKRENIPLLRSPNAFRFGGVTVNSMGLVEIALHVLSPL